MELAMKDRSIDAERNILIDTYRGYRISALQEQSSWLVALNDVLLSGIAFETPQEATAWLRRRVDDRIAEAVFPGLARI